MEFTSSQGSRRNLDFSNTNSVKSLASGQQTYIDAGCQYVLTVTAYDAGGSRMTTGGTTLKATMSNECTMTGTSCVETAGAAQTLSSSIEVTMTDNNDGTYTAKFNPSVTGVVSVHVLVMIGEWQYAYYNNVDRTGSPYTTGTATTLDFDYGTDYILGGNYNYVGASYTGQIVGPYTGTVTFYFDWDDHVELHLDGVTVFNSPNYKSTQTVTFEMVKDHVYDAVMNWFDNQSAANSLIQWSYPGQSLISIPQSALAPTTPKYVVGDPITTTLQYASSLCDPPAPVIQPAPVVTAASTEEEKSSVVYEAEWLYFGFVVALVGLCSFSWVMFKTPSMSMYAVVSFLQMLFLTPLTGIAHHEDIKYLYDNLSYFMFSFSFLPKVVSFTDGDDRLLAASDVKQESEYLALIGLESGSAFVNMGKLIFVIFLLLAVYFIVIWIHIITKNYFSESIIHRVNKYIFDVFHFSLLIRLASLVFVFVMLCSFSEIVMNNEHGDEAGSYFFAMLMFLT